jgi:hypothetical protein
MGGFAGFLCQLAAQDLQNSPEKRILMAVFLVPARFEDGNRQP